MRDLSLPPSFSLPFSLSLSLSLSQGSVMDHRRERNKWSKKRSGPPSQSKNAEAPIALHAHKKSSPHSHRHSMYISLHKAYPCAESIKTSSSHHQEHQRNRKGEPQAHTAG